MISWHIHCVRVIVISICDMIYSYVWLDSFMCVISLFHDLFCRHLYVRHDSFVRVTWIMHVCDMTYFFAYFAGAIVIHICDIIYSYVWRDSFMCMTWLAHYLFHTGDCHSYVWHDSFICVTWLIHMCDMTHLYVRHDSVIRVSWFIHVWNVLM